MKIKNFQALTMSDALRMIKEDLGPEAVILSSKQIRKGGGMFGLFGQAMVEVAAATDVGATEAARSNGRGSTEPALSRGPVAPPLATGDEGLTTGRVASSSLAASAGGYGRRPAASSCPSSSAGRGTGSGGGRWSMDFDKTTGARFEDQLRRQVIQSSSHKERPVLRKEQRPLSPSLPDQRSEPAWEGIKEELQSIRRFMESLPSGMGRGDKPAGPDRLPARLLARHQDFLHIGLESETALRLVTEVLERAQPTDLESDSSVRKALARLLVREIKVGGPLLGMGEWKKTVIVTGPTGVGKTTTIAKLAAHYKLKEKRNVALITLDTYRVAAVEQLRMYANVIGVSMDVALTKREALDCIRRRTKAELILIDTAGRSPKDEAGMEELRQLVDLDHPLETHLVLSATTREQDLREGLTQYAGIPISRLLFTKLDETSGFGGLFDLMRRSGLPLSYFSTGQSVPDDLEVARPERLADLLLGGELRPTATSAQRTASSE